MNPAEPTHLPPAPAPGVPSVRAETVALAADELKLLQPPGVVRGAAPAEAVAGVARQAALAAATTWQSQKTIVSQWTINQDRNSWIGVAGMGWQKLSTASDSGCVSLTKLAAAALTTKSQVSFRQESDGMVHEIYVF